jgi:hypothetical protein
MTHHTKLSMTSLVCATLLGVVLIAQPTRCHADAFLEAKTSFNAYRDRAFKLQNQPQNKYLVGDFTSLTQWMNNAERLLREEKDDDFVRVVHLIRVQLRLIEVSIIEIDARDQLLSLNDEMSRLEGKAKQEREAVVELERKMGGSLTASPRRPQVVPARPNTPVAPPRQQLVPGQPQGIPVQPQMPAGGGR